MTGRVVITKVMTKKRVTLPAYDLRGATVNSPAPERTAGGNPAVDELSRVVIYLEAPGLKPAAPTQGTLTQKNRGFEPEIVVIPVGSTVSFPNQDPIFHNVFSLSKVKQFDLGYYPAGETRTVKFDRPGIVQVYCHIHPDMSAAILVLATARLDPARPRRRLFLIRHSARRVRFGGVAPLGWILPASHYHQRRYDTSGRLCDPRQGIRAGRSAPPRKRAMKPPFSLATRTFLLTFFAMCVAEVAGFFALNAALKARIKDGLKDNLRLTEQQLDQQEAEYNRRATELIATLSENAGLKAAIGLSREQSNPAMRAQVRETIEDQLRQLSKGLDFDLFMVTDTEGAVIATLGPPVNEDEARQVSAGRSSGPWLIWGGHDLFKVTSVPINLGTENLGSLAVGRRFELSSPGTFGYAVLTGPRGIVVSTLPAAANLQVEHRLAEKCGKQEDGCEISAGGQDYLALAMERDWVTPDYQVLRLASIDEAMRGFTQGVRRVFILTGLGGVLIAALFSLLASRSISRAPGQSGCGPGKQRRNRRAVERISRRLVHARGQFAGRRFESRRPRPPPGGRMSCAMPRTRLRRRPTWWS